MTAPADRASALRLLEVAESSRQLYLRELLAAAQVHAILDLADAVRSGLPAPTVVVSDSVAPAVNAVVRDVHLHAARRQQQGGRP